MNTHSNSVIIYSTSFLAASVLYKLTQTTRHNEMNMALTTWEPLAMKLCKRRNRQRSERICLQEKVRYKNESGEVWIKQVKLHERHSEQRSETRGAYAILTFCILLRVTAVAPSTASSLCVPAEPLPVILQKRCIFDTNHSLHKSLNTKCSAPFSVAVWTPKPSDTFSAFSFNLKKILRLRRNCDQFTLTNQSSEMVHCLAN